jgi:hypothetical protein
MTVALFLQLCEILSAIGGAGAAFVKIKQYIDEHGMQPTDKLLAAHEHIVRTLLGPIQCSDDTVWQTSHAPE